MKTKIANLFVSVTALTFSLGLDAHHGIALYDVTESIRLTGTVTDFRFENPHVLVYFSVTGDGGADVTWSAGLTSPNRLARSDGWTRDTLRAGDEITIVGSPTRDGAPSVWVEQIYRNGEPMLVRPGGAG